MSKHVRISPEEAADRLAIRELVEAYAHCADRRDAKGQMALFTPDTHFVVYMNAKDPGDCTALAEALSEQDAAIVCLGTYTGLYRTRTSAKQPWTTQPSSRGFSTAAVPTRVDRGLWTVSSLTFAQFHLHPIQSRGPCCRFPLYRWWRGSRPRLR